MTTILLVEDDPYNAVKFTPTGSEITVRGYRSHDTVRLEVQDSGPGIPPNVLPRAFERFYKYDQARTRSEKAGTGIGLAVVKHLVQATAVASGPRVRRVKARNLR